jgi:adenosylmethionine-8-amino-7-oxononanoate aminotransferase
MTTLTTSILPDKDPIEVKASLPAIRPTSILHRTPWRPPVAVGAEGIYLDLEDGRRIIDGVGGAAVACIGNSHPAVKQAIKDQLDRVSCMYSFHLSGNL